MLGHELQFAYCRQPGADTPCRKIFDCWWEAFDIHSFMDANYDAEVIAKITAEPKPKMLSLVELIERARRNNQ